MKSSAISVDAKVAIDPRGRAAGDGSAGTGRDFGGILTRLGDGATGAGTGPDTQATAIGDVARAAVVSHVVSDTGTIAALVDRAAGTGGPSTPAKSKARVDGGTDAAEATGVQTTVPLGLMSLLIATPMPAGSAAASGLGQQGVASVDHLAGRAVVQAQTNTTGAGTVIARSAAVPTTPTEALSPTSGTAVVAAEPQSGVPAIKLSSGVTQLASAPVATIEREAMVRPIVVPTMPVGEPPSTVEALPETAASREAVAPSALAAVRPMVPPASSPTVSTERPAAAADLVLLTGGTTDATRGVAPAVTKPGEVSSGIDHAATTSNAEAMPRSLAHPTLQTGMPLGSVARDLGSAAATILSVSVATQIAPLASLRGAALPISGPVAEAGVDVRSAPSTGLVEASDPATAAHVYGVVADRASAPTGETAAPAIASDLQGAGSAGKAAAPATNADTSGAASIREAAAPTTYADARAAAPDPTSASTGNAVAPVTATGPQGAGTTIKAVAIAANAHGAAQTSAPTGRTEAPAPDAAMLTASTITTIADAVSDLAEAPATAPTSASVPPSPAIAPARTMVLQLNPPDLGTVAVRLHLTGRTLDVQLSLSDPKTLGIVDREREALAARLDDRGYQLNALVIRGADSPTSSAAGAHDTSHNGAGASAHPDQGADGGGRGASGQPDRDASRRTTGDRQRPGGDASMDRGSGLYI